MKSWTPYWKKKSFSTDPFVTRVLLSCLPHQSLHNAPSKQGTLGLSSGWWWAVLLSLFLQKVKSLLETIKCKYSVFNQGYPRQSFNSCLYLPFKNTVWLICIIFRGRIVRFYYTMGTTALCLYTKNIIRKEIIQTTNPSLVWETVSVKLWRFQIFSFGRPNTEQTSWTAWAYWWAQVRQRPEKRNKKDKSTLTNTVCLVLFFDTRAKWCGIDWIHSINLTYLPTPWGYLTCL